MSALVGQWCRYRLDFKFEALTSRQRMIYKDTYFVRVFDPKSPERTGYGECALFAGLSADDTPDFETTLSKACAAPEQQLPQMSAIRFGFETALADYYSGCKMEPFDSSFSSGKNPIAINGIIWMGDKRTMLNRIADKIDRGFRVLKLKIGGIDFKEELDILHHIRSQFSEKDLQLRLDANGSFTPDNAPERLNRLSEYKIHSIEQPIRAGQTQSMAELCKSSPIAIALDEELIGCRTPDEMNDMIEAIRPQYIILKPSLCGGFAAADDWINIASQYGICWWATSALESNIGLNAIARWLLTKHTTLPQGLGTGELYHNNIPSPLYMDGSNLNFNPVNSWQIPQLQWQQ